MVTLDDFKKLDLRVAQIAGAERVPRTDRLLKLRVDLGNEERTLVAGLGSHYTPEELVGLKVIVVANLQPAIIKGIESNGMLLAAGCSDRTEIGLLTLNRDIPAGSAVQ